MLDLWLGSVPLQGTNEHNNVNTSVGEVGNSTKQRHVQLVQLWAAFVFWPRVLQLSMDNDPKAFNEVKLVKGDFFGDFVLHMPNATVGELMPLKLKLTKHLLDFTKDPMDNWPFASQLQVVNMFAHGSNELVVVVVVVGFSLLTSTNNMLNTKLVIDLARYEPTLVCDSSQLYREGPWCITKASAWLIAMKHFNLRVEVLEARDHPK